MKKRIGFILLAFVLILSVAACGTANTSKNAATAQETTNAAAAPSVTTQEPPTELNIVMLEGTNQNDVDLVIAEVNKITKDKINATIGVTYINAANYSQQIKLMLTSKEKMDLFITGTLPFLDFAGQLANSQLAPLNDLLDKYGQNIKSILGDFLKASTIKGKTYAVPSYRDEAKVAGFALRQDLIDKYKIDMSSIKKLEDIEPVLKIIKENEKDLAPFSPCQSASTGIEVSMHIPGGDALSSDYYFTGVMLDCQDTATKLVNYYETTQCMDMYKLVRKWNLAGYIMPGIVTNTESCQNLIKAGKLASYIQDVKPGVDGQTSRQCGMPMKVVPLAEPISYTGVVGAFMWAIPTHCTVQDKAMQFLNMLYSDSNLVNLVIWGIEGKHYVKNSDGTIQYPEGVDAKSVGYAGTGFIWGNQLLSYVFKGDPADLWKQMEEFNKSAKKSKGLGFMFDPTNVKTEYAACMNVWNQYQKSLGVGAVDPEKVVPEFLSKLKAAGVDKIVAEKQKQFDEFLASNK